MIRLAIVLLYTTGIRRGELLRLTWADVDMKRRTITFRQTKNGHDRTVPMTDALHAMLAALPRPLEATTPVLPRYADPKVLTRAFTRYAARVGLRGVVFHDLRHAAASLLTAAGVSQRAVMEILGHRDPRMTIRYQHLAPGHLRDAIQALDQDRAPRSTGTISAPTRKSENAG